LNAASPPLQWLIEGRRSPKKQPTRHGAGKSIIQGKGRRKETSTSIRHMVDPFVRGTIGEHKGKKKSVKSMNGGFYFNPRPGGKATGGVI